MFALISGLLGFITSAIPQILKIYQDKKDKEHELAMTKIQIEREDKGYQYKLEDAGIQADIASEQAVHSDEQVVLTGNKWFDGLASFYRSSVRPTITYAFFILYALTKYASYISIKSYYTTLSWDKVMEKIWTVEDMSIFCVIIGYWFGQRAMKYYFNKPKA